MIGGSSSIGSMSVYDVSLPLAETHDPFLWYLYGMVLSDMKREVEAREALVTAVTLYPCNWSAWQVRLLSTWHA